MVCSIHCRSFIYDLFLFIVLITSHLFWKTTQNNITFTHLKAVSGPSTEICRHSLPQYPDLVNHVYECIYRLVFVRFLSTDILKHFRSNIKISVSILTIL